MGFFRVLLFLAAASAWMTERGDPRRAGFSHSTTTLWCPAPNCDSQLFPSGDVHVCSNRHVSRWNKKKRKFEQQAAD